MTFISKRDSMLLAATTTLAAPSCPVRIDGQRLAQVATHITPQGLTDWDFYLPRALRRDAPVPMHQTPDDRLLDVAWFFWVQSALNYRYWSLAADGSLDHWVYKGKKGSSGLVPLMQELYDSSPLFGTDLDATAAFLNDRLRDGFYGLPDGNRRAHILHHMMCVGKHVFVRIFARAKQADGSWLMSADLADELANAFRPAFDDDNFLKRAQLSLGMTGANFTARGARVTIDLTAYADYRVPQVLRHLGVLVYDTALADAVDNRRLIPRDSADEVAIRSATLVACADLAARARVSDADVDAWLFLQTREADFEATAKPFHLTVTNTY